VQVVFPNPDKGLADLHTLLHTFTQHRQNALQVKLGIDAKHLKSLSRKGVWVSIPAAGMA
jgi:hypothetical protein